MSLAVKCPAVKCHLQSNVPQSNVTAIKCPVVKCHLCSNVPWSNFPQSNVTCSQMSNGRMSAAIKCHYPPRGQMSIVVYCPVVKCPWSNVPWSNDTVVIGDPLELSIAFLNCYVSHSMLEWQTKKRMVSPLWYKLAQGPDFLVLFFLLSNCHFFQ